MEVLVPLFTVVIAAAAIGLYLWNVKQAVQYTNEGEPSKMHDRQVEMVTLLGAALATNFGTVLGIDMPEVAGFVLGLVGGDPQPSLTLSLGAWMRVTGFLAYAISLALCFWTWRKTGYEEDPTKVVRTIPEQAKIARGVAVGTLVVAFSL